MSRLLAFVLVHPVWTWLHRLGGPGLILLGLADNSIRLIDIAMGKEVKSFAGHTGAVDASGKSLAGDFDAQVRAVFAAMEATLAEAGGKLSDMVTMTVFLTDPRNHRRFTELRREILGENFPASAAIYISHLANPNALLEIQGVAVVG